MSSPGMCVHGLPSTAGGPMAVHPRQFRRPVPVSCPEMPHMTAGGTTSGGALEKSAPP